MMSCFPCLRNAPSAFARRCLIYSRIMGMSENPRFVIDRAYADDFLVMHTLCGTLVLEQYGKKWEIPAGQSVLLSLRDPHKYYFRPGEESRIIWFHFNGVPAQLLMESAKEAGVLPCISAREQMEEEIEGLARIQQSGGPQREQAVSGEIYRILLEYLAPVLPEMERCCDPRTPFQEKMSRFIREHLQSGLTLEQLAREAGMSRTRFCAEFRRSFGMTAFAWIQQEKIEAAKQLLAFSGESICQISNALQFHDQSHFSSTFRRLTGMTPKAYRRQI